MSDERRQPASGPRREAVELRCDALGSLELGGERLDETVEGPLVVRGEAAERRDRGNADFALVAAQTALEQRPSVGLVHRPAAGAPAGWRRKHPPAGDLRAPGRQASTRSQARDGDRGREQ
jgi:hypothetical protein